MNLPQMFRMRQRFARPIVADVQRSVRHEMAALAIDEAALHGRKIGITVGSRGIENILPILTSCVSYFREMGALPFLIAAMGSHGGGLDTGQEEVLKSLGITQTSLDAPVVTCSECHIVAGTTEGLPIHVLKSALEMDGLLIVNRVKLHTSLDGFLQSGLVKMLVAGLGGPKGAQLFHSRGQQKLPMLLKEIGQEMINTLPVLGGLAIVENAYEETALIRGVRRDAMIEQESELLMYSKTLMPSLPVNEIDLLIIQEMGKNFSGTGMDTNIIGRMRIFGVPEPEEPLIKRIGVLDLSEASHGNATGIGMADFVTQRLLKKMDRQKTYLNCLTTTFVGRAAIPMYFDSDKELVEAAVSSLGGIDATELRVVIIPNTLCVSECFVSEAVMRDVSGNQRMEFDANPKDLAFDNAQRLLLRIR